MPGGMPLGTSFWSTWGMGGMRELESGKRVAMSASTKKSNTMTKKKETTKTIRLLPSECQRCMKNSTTRVTLMQAMKIAAGRWRCPMGSRATPKVVAVSARSTTQTRSSRPMPPPSWWGCVCGVTWRGSRPSGQTR